MGFAFVIVLFFIVGLFILNIATSVWAYRDCLNRGKSYEYALVVLFGTIIFPVMGLIVYLIVRHD